MSIRTRFFIQELVSEFMIYRRNVRNAASKTITVFEIALSATCLKKFKDCESDQVGGKQQKRTVDGKIKTSSAREEILRRQLDSTSANRRDVYGTVRCQLAIARNRFNVENGRPSMFGSNVTTQEMRKARQYIENMSALEIPPSFASFAGMGSYPYRLYSCIGFDKLHVIEHGILRMIPDDAFRVFESALQYHGWSKGEIIKLANQRILDAPRSAQLPTFQPFRKNASEKQAGVTGKIRRDSAPFLWYSLMGVSRNTVPGDDPLVQLLLKVDFMQQQLLGINQEPSFAFRTRDDIEALAKFCFDTGKQLIEVLGSFVTTKVHRVMRHISDHLLDHGCIRRGATDDNEKMHKVTRKAYRSTNKHLINISSQLLSARVLIERETEDTGENIRDETDSLPCVLLLKRNPTVKEYSKESVEIVKETDLNSTLHVTEDELAATMSSLIPDGCCPSDAQNLISSHLHPTSNRNSFTTIKSVRFKATLPWSSETKVWQVLYAGSKVFNTANRRDAVLYSMAGIAYYGIIQAIYRHRSNKRLRVLLLRRLKHVPAEKGNLKVVEEFRNRTFSYAISNGDVKLDCVPVSRLVRVSMIVPDPFVVSRLYGAKIRFNELPDDKRARKSLCFFELSGFKYSSLDER